MSAVHELGSHFYSHDDMAYTRSRQLAEDLDRCAAFFAEIGRPVNVSARPYGSFAPGPTEIVPARGIEHMLLVGEPSTTTGRGVYIRITMYGASDRKLRLPAVGHRRRWRTNTASASG